jgi:hypothetical protein
MMCNDIENCYQKVNILIHFAKRDNWEVYFIKRQTIGETPEQWEEASILL